VLAAENGDLQKARAALAEAQTAARRRRRPSPQHRPNFSRTAPPSRGHGPHGPSRSRPSRRPRRSRSLGRPGGEGQFARCDGGAERMTAGGEPAPAGALHLQGGSGHPRA
jgi:hypothetical protein